MPLTGLEAIESIDADDGIARIHLIFTALIDTFPVCRFHPRYTGLSASERTFYNDAKLPGFDLHKELFQFLTLYRVFRQAGLGSACNSFKLRPTSFSYQLTAPSFGSCSKPHQAPFRSCPIHLTQTGTSNFELTGVTLLQAKKFRLHRAPEPF